MAVLRIKGTAEKEYHYDVMTITVTFRAKDHSSAKALNEVMDQSEGFLAILQERGIDISKLRLGRNELSEFSHKEALYMASRGVVIVTKFNMALLNEIDDIVSNKRFDALLDSNYDLSNENEMRDDLIKEAIEDSKKKAELACSVTGQKIIGIKKIDLGETEDYYYKDKLHFVLKEGSARLSDKLQSPTTTLDESVMVVWEIQ